MKPLLPLAIVAVLCTPSVSFGQSLADVARAEDARRKNVKKSAKVYTNDDLKADFTMPATSTPSPQGEPAETSAPAGGGETPAESSQADQKAAAPPKSDAEGGAKDEAAWRKRIAAARGNLQRSQMFAEALQSRINALTTDFVNRDDPAQRTVIEQDRQKALAELDRVKKEQAQQTKAIADIEEEARKAGVPAGWLR